MGLKPFSHITRRMILEEGGGDLSARGRPGVWEFARIAEFGETVTGDGFEEFDLAW